jgi:hypothetical protein
MSSVQAEYCKPWAPALSARVFDTQFPSAHMLDEIISETDRALVPSPPAVPEKPTPPDMKTQPGAGMFGAIPLREPEKLVSGADVPPLSPDAVAPEIKIQPAEIRGRSSRKDKAADKASPRQGASFFARVLGYAGRAIVVAGLCAFAWAAGAYYSTGHSPFVLAKSAPALAAQPSAGHDDMLNAMRQMTDEVRALKANVAQDAGQKAPLNTAPAPAGVTTADLMGRIDKLDADFSAKLAQVNQQLASLEQQAAASHAALAARAAAAHKHLKPHLHDAFNPAQDPGAPGAPRPLGDWQH